MRGRRSSAACCSVRTASSTPASARRPGEAERLVVTSSNASVSPLFRVVARPGPVRHRRRQDAVVGARTSRREPARWRPSRAGTRSSGRSRRCSPTARRCAEVPLVANDPKVLGVLVDIWRKLPADDPRNVDFDKAAALLRLGEAQRRLLKAAGATNLAGIAAVLHVGAGGRAPERRGRSESAGLFRNRKIEGPPPETPQVRGQRRRTARRSSAPSARASAAARLGHEPVADHGRAPRPAAAGAGAGRRAYRRHLDADLDPGIRRSGALLAARRGRRAVQVRKHRVRSGRVRHRDRAGHRPSARPALPLPGRARGPLRARSEWIIPDVATAIVDDQPVVLRDLVQRRVAGRRVAAVQPASSRRRSRRSSS